MTWWLVALMFYPTTDGDITVRRSFEPTPSAAVCQRAAKELEELWRAEKPAATLLVECVPIQMTKPAST